MSDIDQLPAFERTQTRVPDSPPRTPRSVPAWRTALAAVLLVVAIGVAFLWFRPDPSEADDLLLVLAETASGFQPDRPTTESSVAQQFVMEALGWSIEPPDLPTLAIVGVGLPTIGEIRATPAADATQIQIPAFRYESADGARTVLFAYDYILLDQIQSKLDIPEGTYAALSEPTPVDSRVVEGSYVVTWRVRAMVFSAVTSNEAVADLIRQAASA